MLELGIQMLDICAIALPVVGNDITIFGETFSNDPIFATLGTLGNNLVDIIIAFFLFCFVLAIRAMILIYPLSQFDFFMQQLQQLGQVLQAKAQRDSQNLAWTSTILNLFYVAMIPIVALLFVEILLVGFISLNLFDNPAINYFLDPWGSG